MSSLLRGRLRDPSSAPATGEKQIALVSRRTLEIEQILSGPSDGPVEYLQEQDEWVVLLAGRASMIVGGEPIELGAGDWVFLPARVPHAVLRTDQGTSWLAVHLHPAEPSVRVRGDLT
jgi:cupin 2 domain-containing protein